MRRLKSYFGLVVCPFYLFYASCALVEDLARGPSVLMFPDITIILALPGVFLLMFLAEPFGGLQITQGNRLLVYVPDVLVTAALIYLLCFAAEKLLLTIMNWLGLHKPDGHGLR